MDEIRKLIDRYQLGLTNPEENVLVEAWYASLANGEDRPGRSPEQTVADREAVWKQLEIILNEPGERQYKPRRLSRWLPYAAAAVIALAIGAWVVGDRWLADDDKQLSATEILPGGNRAMLTLADGRVVNLDETQTGIIVGAEDITYQDGSALDVISSEDAGRRDVSLLELTTPKGGTYQITLPDGSKVWLNAGSTLKYPSRFSGDTREVILEGEAFFDIKETQVAGGTRDKRAPFKVQTSGQTVEVLGTQFNISAYADDPETKTTLVEGKVRVDGAVGAYNHAPDKSSVLLSPGEQSTLRGAEIAVNSVDLDPYIAWKQGYFSFAEDLESVMKQLARWYVVEVEFRDEALKKLFVFGRGERSRPLSEVLRLLEEATEARFVVEENKQGERRVVVMR